MRGRSGVNTDSARMAKLQRALDIGGMEDAFESCLIGFEVVNDGSHSLVNYLQAKGKGVRRINSNNAAIDKNTIGAIGFDDAVSCDA